MGKQVWKPGNSIYPQDDRLVGYISCCSVLVYYTPSIEGKRPKRKRINSTPA